MIIKTLAIQNFGIYKGHEELELAPENKWKNPRPIVLVGGKNGAGKSTIFEAIKLCLYGQKSISGKTSTNDYHEYLKSRINWFCPDDESTLVEMTFTIFRDNQDPTLARDYEYKISREWYSTKNGKIVEDFKVYEDGTLLELDSSFWQDFIEEAIPQGVVDLFFFDGEKIQGLAEGGNKDLQSAIKSLLNLSIIPSLSNDLTMIYKKFIENNNDSNSQKLIVDLKSQIEKITLKRVSLTDDYATANTKAQATRSHIRKLEEKLKKSGGEYYIERDQLQSQQGEAKSKKKSVVELIAKATGDYIPFLLAPKLINKVENQLKKEVQISEKEVTRTILSSKRKELDKLLSKVTQELKLNNDVKAKLKSKISGYTESWVLDLDEESKYNLTLNEVRRSLDVIESLPESYRELKEFYKEVEVQERNIKRLEEKIQRACDNDIVIEIHNKINEQTLILGGQEAKVLDFDKLINQIDRELNELNKKLDKAYNLVDKSEDNASNYGRIENIQFILADFEKELTKKKVEQLEETILDCYSRIHRKSGFIRSITIDPESFNVTMFDRHNKMVPVSKLSAGEKQIYAISVLWALSKLSGKSLPMVIDTPLGRLDSSHRASLVNNFFPSASHQVVILSTDTEIDHKYFEELNKYVSHTYNIDFNLENSHSNVESGYFFESGAIQ